MLHHSVPNGRGEVGLMPCPGCGDFHRSMYRIAGIPVLECPLAPPHVMHLMRVHKSARGGVEYVINVGPEPEPTVSSNISVPTTVDIAKTEKRRTA